LSVFREHFGCTAFQTASLFQLNNEWLLALPPLHFHHLEYLPTVLLIEGDMRLLRSFVGGGALSKLGMLRVEVELLLGDLVEVKLQSELRGKRG
jgi:hypothetical protein